MVVVVVVGIAVATVVPFIASSVCDWSRSVDARELPDVRLSDTLVQHRRDRLPSSGVTGSVADPNQDLPDRAAADRFVRIIGL